MKKLILLLLVLTMVLGCFCACEKEPSNPPVQQPVQQDLLIVSDGNSEYEIVYASNGAAWERKLALQLRNVIEDATGVKLTLKGLDSVDSAALSDTKCIAILSVPSDGAYEYGYEICTSGSSLLFRAASKTGAYFALCAFAQDRLGIDLNAEDSLSTAVTSLEVSADYHKTETVNVVEFPYLAQSAKSVAISYQWDNYIQKRMAVRLRDQIYYATGATLSYESYQFDETELDPDCAHVIFGEDDTLKNGDWSIRAEGQNLYITAGDYNGFVSALRTIEAESVHEWGFYTCGQGDSKSGNYLTTLDSKIEDASRYAYERQGEHRILFYNVLFHNTTATRPNLPNDIPASERNLLQAAMIEVYRPDVLALQEVAKSKRQGAGQQNIETLLSELGYAETVDPRVENSKPVEDGGWGVSGERVVDENGNEFYTNYNMDPLFYNTATTRCLESEYYWFKNHQDEETGTPDAGEFSTKASTWGVFESIATGERYIVVSAHLTGRSSGVQLKQVQELADIIAGLVEKYDCPAFLGGDCNGRMATPFYEFLTEDADFISLQDQNGAENTSQLVTTHGYPCYDVDLGIMTEGSGSVSTVKSGSDSIDKAFATNIDSTEIALFGVIADECSLSASDHLPMLIDFSIGAGS